MREFKGSSLALLSNSRLFPVVAGFGSFLLSLTYIVTNGWGRGLLSVHPFSDSYWHLHRAWHSAVVAAEGGASVQFVPDAPYLWLLTLSYKLLGVWDAVPFLLNAAFLAVGVFFITKLVLEYYDERTGLMAAVLSIFYGPFLFFVGITVKTSLAVCLISAGLYFAVCYLNKHKSRFIFASVLSFSVMALDRNNAVVLIFALALFVIYNSVKKRSFVHFGSSFIAAAVAISLTLLISPWNSSANEQKFFSPIGLNFYVGNSPGSTGGYTPLEEGRNHIIGHFIDGQNIAEREVGRALNRWEVSQYWFEKSFNYYREHPFEFVTLQIRKLGMLSAQYAPGLPEEYRIWRWQRPALAVALVDFGLLLSLALFGLVTLKKRPLKPHETYLLLGIVLYAGSFLVFEVSERYKVPLAPMLIPFASIGLAKIVWPSKDTNRKRVMFAVLALYLITMGLNLLNTPGPGWSDDSASAKRAYTHAFKRINKEYQLKAQIAQNPDAQSWLKLAESFTGKDVYTDAYQYAENALLLDPGSEEAFTFLIKTANQHGDAEYTKNIAERIGQLKKE